LSTELPTAGGARTGRPDRGPKAALAEAIGSIDDTIHQRARLGILSAILSGGEADFRWLKEVTGLTDGNLAAHLLLLEERGFLTVRKEFVGRRPHTTYTPTSEGRAAFAEYLEALERIIQAARP
jgi:DNA-binding HxlR family transcriptional regulator